MPPARPGKDAKRSRPRPASDPAGPKHRRRPLLLPACLVAGLSLLTYLPVLWHEFVEWDDRSAIVSNRWLNPPTGAGLVHYWTELRPPPGVSAPCNYTL